MADVAIVQVGTAAQRAAFVDLPWQLYRHDRYWVPPLRRDEHALFDKTRNPFFAESEADFFLALRDGRAVGRIAAIKYRRHLEAFDDATAFFGFFESIDSQEVATALFEAAASWAQARGLTRIIGPYNFTFDDGGGLLVEGFDDAPTYKMNYNAAHYGRLVDAAGFRKMLDLYTYDIDLTRHDGSRLEKVSERILSRGGIRIDTVDLSHFDRDVADCHAIYQEAFTGAIGTVDLSLEKFREMADSLRKYCDPELFYIARHGDQAVGLGVVIPDLNPLFRRWNGRLFPWALIDLGLRRHRRLRRARYTLIATRSEYRRLGIDTAILHRGLVDARRKGFTHGEASWIQESNALIQKPLERVGFRRAKTYRIYERPTMAG